MAGDNHCPRLPRHLMKFSDRANSIDGGSKESRQRLLVPVIERISRVNSQDDGTRVRRLL
jgi:hypothetical protein